MFITGLPGKSITKIAPKNNYSEIVYQNDSNKYDDVYTSVLKNNVSKTQLIYSLSGGHIHQKDSTFNLFLIDTIIQFSMKGAAGFSRSIGFSLPIMSTDGTIYFPFQNNITSFKNRKQLNRYCFPGEVYKLYFDKDGDLWVGTRDHGVYLFKKGDLSKPPIHSLPSLSVTSILLDKEEAVFVSTEQNGIFQCMNKHVLKVQEKAMALKIFNNKLNVALASKKELIASAFDSIQLKNTDVIEFANTKLTNYYKKKGMIYYVLLDHLYLFQNGSIREIVRPSKQPFPTDYIIEFPNDTILGVNTFEIFTIFGSKLIREFRPPFAICFATRLPNKKLLITSRFDQGIFEFKNNQIIPFLDHFKELKTRVNCITMDSAGNYWIATNERGLFCYDTKKQLHSFNDNNGLISNKVNSCIVSANGDVWCSTFFGLSKLTMSKGIEKIQIENFDNSHGLAELEIGKIAWFNNTIWCAGKSAFFFFEADKMKKNTHPPAIYLKSLNVANKNYRISDSLFLNHDQNDFRVQYELLSSKKINSPTFLYKLDGYDENWRTSHTGDIQYTNIKFGTYTLLVYGVNSDGIGSTSPQRITFIIKRPFWFTWWFMTLSFILLAAVTYACIHYWKNKIEKKERDKAAINQQLAEFKMTALRSQMNPHFIYNAIGSIQHYILKNEIDQSFNYLSKFSSLIRKILNNSANEYISLEQEISTLQLYIELEQIRFKHPFKFILTIDEELDMYTEIPTMLIQPYIENSIWHRLMPKETEGCLELTFKKIDSTIHVQIKDNGVDRETGEMRKKHHISKGMSLTEQRIQTLENTSNKKFVTTVIDLKDEYNRSLGTEVNLIIPFDE